MAFQVIKTFVVDAPPTAVWRFLLDPRRVANCLPGAAITGKVDDKTFTGTMTVKVGPVTTSYKGKVVFERVDEDEYAAEIVASGQDVKGKGGANMKLRSTLKECAPGQTEITAVSDLTVTGLLAQMGRGMIQDVSDELFQIFSQRVKSELEAERRPTPAATPALEREMPGQQEVARPVSQATLHAPASPSARAADEQVLDLGAIGSRAAGRAALRLATRPIFWLVVVAVVGLLYLWFRR